MNINFLADLNPAQLEAVTFPEGNLLVLAGAGSGKTRVLVHRIAWLLSQGLALTNILAVTFTNKAASEMRSRLELMLGGSLAHLWIGTFHGLAHRLLRIHYQEAGLDQAFQIIDAEDQLRLIKKIHKLLALDNEKWSPKQSQLFINQHKERGVRAVSVNASNSMDAILTKVYLAYEDSCRRSNLVDFTELLLRSYELWRNQHLVLEHYQQRFKAILVDEFQDTNTIQYSWIKLLTGLGCGLTAVGDDDQSIYSWRGADSGNLQRMINEYSAVKVIRLEQNYRSTAMILKAANAVIQHNSNRLGKKLWTDGSSGEPIVTYAAFNETDEARYIVDKIKYWVNLGKVASEIAVLYRSNAQSRVIEEQLLQARIPYRIYSGMRFFERSEIKDVLAYLRLLVNPDDDASFERVINLPVRGLGEAALTLLRNYARANQLSLWQAAKTISANQAWSARMVQAFAGFERLIYQGREELKKLSLGALVELLINLTNLRAHYAKPQFIEYQQSRLENLDELITAANQFTSSNFVDDNVQLLQTFLSHVALEAGEVAGNDQDSVKLMTLHAAKGLEFPVVFLSGMEDGLFPNIMAMGTVEELEEERRLCYVGMTRAMQKLYLSYAESRQLHGSSSMRRPSRFLREIPQNLLAPDLLLNSVKPALWQATSRQEQNQGFYLGQIISHPSFGEGVITGFEGEGDGLLVKIRFKKVGSKLLAASYAKLKAVS